MKGPSRDREGGGERSGEGQQSEITMREKERGRRRPSKTLADGRYNRRSLKGIDALNERW